MPSSAVAAQYAKDNKNILCIVNSMALNKYKLKLINKNIQDYSENKTRFLVIGKNKVEMISVNTPSGERNFEILDIEYV